MKLAWLIFLMMVCPSIHVAFVSSFRWTSLLRWQLTRKMHKLRPDEKVDDYFMYLALREAERAAKEYNEVPIGAVIVRQKPTQWHTLSRETSFEVLSVASNRVETHYDASAHAELIALQQAARKIGNWRLYNTTLYSTLEPCPMCLSAALNFRVDRIVYGAPDFRLGAIETFNNSLIEQHPYHTIHRIDKGVMAEESAQLLQNFFRKRRKEAKNE
jgi:tRNA(adenine34) deaminase